MRRKSHSDACSHGWRNKVISSGDLEGCLTVTWRRHPWRHRCRHGAQMMGQWGYNNEAAKTGLAMWQPAAKATCLGCVPGAHDRPHKSHCARRVQPHEYILIILETDDVQRHRGLCKYGAIKMLYFVININTFKDHFRNVTDDWLVDGRSNWREVATESRRGDQRRVGFGETSNYGIR